MRSHTYTIASSDLGRLMGPPFLVVALIAGFLRIAASLGFLPETRSIPDMDHVVLWEQTRHSRSPVSWVLTGDSSCLMNISGKELAAQLGRPVANLGTISLLDLASYALLASNAVVQVPADRSVVLLVHPDFLMRPAADSRFVAQLRALQGGEAASEKTVDGTWKLSAFLSLDLVRDKLESHLRGFPLSGAFGHRYGFTSEVLKSLRQDNGLVDPRRYRPDEAASRPLEISPRLEPSFRDFRGFLPPGTRIFVGLTPLPASEASPDVDSRRNRALATLGGWIGGDVVLLDSLPAVLPDSEFATRTHLSERGRIPFTRRLGELLSNSRHLR